MWGSIPGRPGGGHFWPLRLTKKMDNWHPQSAIIVSACSLGTEEHTLPVGSGAKGRSRFTTLASADPRLVGWSLWAVPQYLGWLCHTGQIHTSNSQVPHFGFCWDWYHTAEIPKDEDRKGRHTWFSPKMSPTGPGMKFQLRFLRKSYKEHTYMFMENASLVHPQPYRMLGQNHKPA
jgi:hypothetical protein